MAQFSKIQIIQTAGAQGLMPLFFHTDVEVGKKILRACYQGGARLLEFTNRGDFAHEVFGLLNKFCQKELPGMAMGVGSVTDAGTASLFMQLGANFIVSASFRADIAVVCNRRKVPYMPGCGSLTEVGTAEEMGCDIVKLFPGSVYGPGFIKAIKGPQAWTNIMPTGGVAPNLDNLKQWFGAGAYCVGMGSKLMVKLPSGDYDYPEIERLTKQSLDWIQEIRNKK